MDLFVAQQNIDHYLGLLDSPDLPKHERGTIRDLLKEEVERLHPHPDHLVFVEKRLTGCQRRAADIQHLRDSLTPGSTDWEETAEVLAHLKDTLNLLWKTCQQLRLRVNRKPS